VKKEIANNISKEPRKQKHFMGRKVGPALVPLHMNNSQSTCIFF